MTVDGSNGLSAKEPSVTGGVTRTSRTSTGQFQRVLERQCRRHYMYNPTVAEFLIREGRVSSDLARRMEFRSANK